MSHKLPYVPDRYSVGPAMSKLGDEKHLIIDDEYDKYISDKRQVKRKRDIFLRTDKPKRLSNKIDKALDAATQWLAQTLKTEYGWGAHQYNFDCLCEELQEDVCLMVDKELHVTHVSFPSWWNPIQKLGMTMADIHANVPDMGKTAYDAIWNASLHKGPFIRYNWSITDTDELDQHTDSNIGKDFDSGCGFYIRVERQILVGLPEVKTVLFLIRTFVESVRNLNMDERYGIAKAIEGMSPDDLEYKGLTKHKDKVILGCIK